MNQKYPNKCIRCGFCCLSENCPAAIQMYSIPKHGVLCPALSFEEGIACCNLIKDQPEKLQELFGIGAGCCMKATAYIKGVKFDFAELSAKDKIEIVEVLKEN